MEREIAIFVLEVTYSTEDKPPWAIGFAFSLKVLSVSAHNLI